MALMNFCMSCGAALAPGARFCQKCGTSLGTSESPSAAAVQGQYSPDGKWWWNGAQWVSVPVAAAVATPSEAAPAAVQAVAAAEVGTAAEPPTPTAAVLPGSAVPAATAPSPKRKRGKWMGMVVAASVIAGAGLALGWAAPFPYTLLGVAGGGVLMAVAAGWNPNGAGRAITKMAAAVRLPGIKPASSGWKAAALIAAFLVALPAGAGALGQYAKVQVENAPVMAGLTGDAYVASFLSGAQVDAWELSPDGNSSVRVGQATTDKNGHYRLAVSKRPGSVLVVTTAGGSYVDQAFLKPTTAAKTDSLQTVLLPGVTDGLLTPLTTMASSRTMSLIEQGWPAAASYAVSYSAVARQYGLESIDSINPAVANDPVDAAAEDRAAREEGLVLSGLDAEAYRLKVSNFALSDALASDLFDGSLDGMAGGKVVSIDGGSGPVVLPADAGTAAWQQGIDTFAAAKGNSTHLQAPRISLLALVITLSTGSLYATSNALPAFVDGQAATASLDASGGMPPYACALTSGAMPVHFELQDDCRIAYDGTKLLGSSAARVVGPFEVTLHDSVHAGLTMQAIKIEIPDISLVGPPPVIEAVGGNCPAATVECTVTAATASGGATPYDFKYGIATNSPLGLFISTVKADAILTGKPAKAGSYDFEVCVDDFNGAQACTLVPRVKVVVGQAPSTSTAPATSAPTAAPTALPTPVPPPDRTRLSANFPAIPDGTYNISSCTVADGCSIVSTKVVSGGDVSGIQAEIGIAAAEVQSACGDGSYSYTAFTGAAFDVVFRCPNAGIGGDPTPWLEVAKAK